MPPPYRRTSVRPFRKPAHDFKNRRKGLRAGRARLGAVAALLVLFAAGLYSGAAAAATTAGWLWLLPPSLLQPAAAEAIATYEADCVTPSSTFELGDTVCARVSGARLGAGGNAARRVNWVARTGSVVQSGDVTADPQNFSFTLPSSETTLITDDGGGAVTVDNRGVWKVYVADASESSFRTGAAFTVRAPTPYADLKVSQSATVENAGVGAGSSSVFEIFVTNAGPDDAADVVVSDTIPGNTSYVSLDESTNLGFACSATAGAGGVPGCTLASMPAGSTARIVLAYSVGDGAAAGTVLTNSVAVDSATAELEPGDNSVSFDSAVPTAAGAQTCSLTCREDMAVTASATQGGQPGAFVNFSAAGQVGDCGAISASPASGSFFPVGPNVVNVSSATGGGSCSFIITVLDTPAPTISCPADKTATAGDDGTAAVDPGTPATSPSTGTSVAGVRSDGAALTAPYPAGVTIITWTVSDSAGRQASCNQRVTVSEGACEGDTTAPTLNAPASITIGTGADGTGCSIALDDELGQATATDDCPAAVTVTRSGVPAGNLFPIGTTTVTYTATDAAGNAATATQTVTVVDDTKPVIVAPPDAAYTCLSEVPAASPSQATRGVVLDENGNPLPPGPPFDNCGAPVVTVTEASAGAGTAASPRVITRTFRATDSAGNFSEAVQTITVTDPTAPELTVPADIVVGNDAGSCSAAVNFSATATDNCNADGVNVQLSHAPGSVFPKGTTAVTATATDWAGNTTTKTFNVTVNDTEGPAISYPSAGVTVYLPLNSPATSTAVSYAVTAADNCAVQSLDVSPASGSVFPVGTTTVTATATDTSGNTTVRQFTVTVLYNFTGFFQPVVNTPTLNVVNAGRSVPVKFSLSGNKGLGIFPAGSPASQQISCSSTAPTSDLEGTETPGGSSLSYDAATDQYHYNWKTEKSWAGQCRALVVTLNDGSTHTAYFKFK